MREPRLIRRKQRWERDFTQIPNRYLRDTSISLKARGLLGMLMSHEEGRSMTIKQIAIENKVGVAYVRTAVEELEQAGYLVRHPIHKRGQFIGDDWELCDPAEALFTGLDAVFENRTRDDSAFENRTRTAFENRTPIRTPEEESKTSRGNHRGACGHELVTDRHCMYGCPVSVVTGSLVDA